jgi:hypothetical protein
MFKPGHTVFHPVYGAGTVVRSYPPDRVLIDFERGQKLFPTNSPFLSPARTVHLRRVGADEAWKLPVPRRVM